MQVGVGSLSDYYDQVEGLRSGGRFSSRGRSIDMSHVM